MANEHSTIKYINPEECKSTASSMLSRNSVGYRSILISNQGRRVWGRFAIGSKQKWLLRAGTDDKNPLFSLLVMNIVARCDGHGLWHWPIHTLGWEWALECFWLLRVVVIKNSACSSSHYFMACAFCIFANDPLKFAFRIKGADDSTITALQPYSMQSGSAERSSSSAH